MPEAGNGDTVDLSYWDVQFFQWRCFIPVGDVVIAKQVKFRVICRFRFTDVVIPSDT